MPIIARSALNYNPIIRSLFMTKTTGTNRKLKQQPLHFSFTVGVI